MTPPVDPSPPSSPTPSPAPAAPPASSTPADPRLARLASALGSSAVLEQSGALPALRLPAAEIPEAARRLRAAGYDYLLFVTAVDYPAEQRFEVVYALADFAHAPALALVTHVDRAAPRLATVSDVWPGAEWHEREVFDLFGIRFDGHPDLRRILLDDTWTGHPLRKDYTDPAHGMIKRPY